ncbi:YqeB family protein [Plantactinospora endophytica]|uniref:DUF308 domain-containing protein n=1 Tax=Plantactinospora endophytica TaxID=673535 RepID=A0ABQ4DUN2_9ACTN|nr:hypothetical protein [Plantactinospora endophytica]GIG86148.1 hypothetical protein Pen02_10840 [Plantactinospora endophytica]
MTAADPTPPDRTRPPTPDATGSATSGAARHGTPGDSRHATSGDSRHGTSGDSRHATSGDSRGGTSGDSRAAASGAPTVVAEPASHVALVWLLAPVLGAALFWLVQASAGWIASLRWIPMRGPFKLIDAVDEPWATGGALLLGTLGGLLVAGIAAAERLAVTVAGDGVTLVRGDATRRVDRTEITGAFWDSKRLVLLGRAAEELARERTGLPADRLGAAFEAHGYRWYADGDPYGADFRRWTDRDPALPAGANGLLKARQRALDKGDKPDLAELRAELLRLGVVVREEGKRQHWRRTRPVGTAGNGPDDESSGASTGESPGASTGRTPNTSDGRVEGGDRG